jgi:hypothetical protein
MKKKINVISIFRNFKDSFSNNLKYVFFTRILPFTLTSYFLYEIYTYKLYSLLFKDKIFTVQEEKQIAKKLFPILKYKNIEKLYSTESVESKRISYIYTSLINYLKMNLKSETFVIKSDLIYLHILHNGSLFISDTFLNILKDEVDMQKYRENYEYEQDKLISFFILNNLLHIKKRHVSTNLKEIYSKVIREKIF